VGHEPPQHGQRVPGLCVDVGSQERPHAAPAALTCGAPRIADALGDDLVDRDALVGQDPAHGPVDPARDRLVDPIGKRGRVPGQRLGVGGVVDGTVVVGDVGHGPDSGPTVP
jgi:hypothetical protein